MQFGAPCAEGSKRGEHHDCFGFPPAGISALQGRREKPSQGTMVCWVEERELRVPDAHSWKLRSAREDWTVHRRCSDPPQRDLTEDLADTKLYMGEMIFHDPEPSPVPSKEQLLWSYGLSHDQSLDEAEKPLISSQLEGRDLTEQHELSMP